VGEGANPIKGRRNSQKQRGLATKNIMLCRALSRRVIETQEGLARGAKPDHSEESTQEWGDASKVEARSKRETSATTTTVEENFQPADWAYCTQYGGQNTGATGYSTNMSDGRMRTGKACERLSEREDNASKGGEAPTP